MVAQLTPGGAASAALAAERAPSAGRAVHAVDLPGVLAPPRAGTVSLLGALAFQRLAELAPRLVLGTRLALQAPSIPGVRPGLRIVRLRRRVSHVGLLPPRGYVHSLAYQVPPGRQPPRCRAAAPESRSRRIPRSEGYERQAHAGVLGADRGIWRCLPPDLLGEFAGVVLVVGADDQEPPAPYDRPAFAAQLVCQRYRLVVRQELDPGFPLGDPGGEGLGGFGVL